MSDPPHLFLPPPSSSTSGGWKVHPPPLPPVIGETETEGHRPRRRWGDTFCSSTSPPKLLGPPQFGRGEQINNSPLKKQPFLAAMMEGARQRGGPPVKGEPPQKGGGEGDEEGGVVLKKEIGLLSACGVIVGNIIGSGIFVSPRGVLEQTGSVGLSLLVWGGAGVVTAGGALCYAELGLAVPRPGGDYAYIMEAFGGLVGFLRLWLLVLVIFPTTQAVIALTFASYLLYPFSPTPCHSPDPTLDPALRLLAAACVAWWGPPACRTPALPPSWGPSALSLSPVLSALHKEPPPCHLHLPPPCHSCLRPGQCRLRHRHVTSGAPPIAGRRCDIWGEGAGQGFGMGDATGCGPGHLWGSQRIPLHLLSVVLRGGAGGAAASPAGHDPRGATHAWPCPPPHMAALLVLRRRDPHRPRPFRVPTVLPVLYLLLWGWLGGAALLREPLLCGLGLGVSLLPTPLYLLAMRGKGPWPPALRRARDAVTHFGQRLFLVVYPQPAPQSNDPTTHSDDPAPHGDNPMTHSDDPAPPSDPRQPLTSQPHS
ncbi:uncharacterized protein LOC135996900 isoform X2 [Caloenas nicobarica]|uniref:uncharacterized protein LOC135996900 isoform X2 n=1 Tax=Caloenas nicobarica TaxID=187106 RepID=UPI0032B7CC5B